MIRSPLFYVGDKYKLITQLKKNFPRNIDIYVEPFFGGGSSQLQINAKTYLLNDLNKYVIKLHKFLLNYKDKKEKFFKELFEVIDKYGLSCSFKNRTVPKQIKEKFPKTYYSKYNKKSYEKLKADFNNKGCNNMLMLYVLLIYGFNHMLRFNNKGKFNLPVGNVDFNKNVFNALNNYFDLQKSRDIKLFAKDYKEFLLGIRDIKKCFIYFDPPYLISDSEYNKHWTKQKEVELYNLIDKLSKKGMKFGLTNLMMHKGKINTLFETWSKKYKRTRLKSNYISFNNNTIKNDSIELYVYN